MQFNVRAPLAVMIVVSLAVMLMQARPASAYDADPEIVRQIESLQPGRALLLPPAKHFAAGKPINGEGSKGPYARDYTNRMAYAPDRGTAFYCGGNHNNGRTNDVWEFHLAANSWHRLHDPDGGDHARFKFALMFYPRQMAKDANSKLTDKQQKEVDECQAWWKENVAFIDGNFVMKNTGAPLLVSHTWDTLIYDPVNKRMIMGYGGHSANVPWLEHRYNGTPLAEVEAKHGKRADGTPWRRPWTFDPATGKWSPYAHATQLAALQGMGGSMLYIPDQQKAVWYYAGQNTPGAPHIMCLWDLKNDTWEELKPNDGVGIGKLALKDKIAPESEQQMAYVTPRKQIVAVMKRSTFIYDFATNKWSKPNQDIPFDAHDAETIFAYDESAGVCLLAEPRKNLLAAYDPATNKWTSITAEPAMPKPPYNVGKGYYDPAHNVFVIQSAYQNRMWLYRHAARK